MSDHLPNQSLVGIPGTISEAASHIRWIRGKDIENPAYGLSGRSYRAFLPDGDLIAVVSHDAAGSGGKRLWHISVSHRDRDGQPDRCPTWDELKHAAYRLIQADVPMVLIFPRRSTPADQYVNVHPTTLHLWESGERTDQ